MAKPQKADIFTRFTTAISIAIGRPWVFEVALGVLLVWAVSGPFLGFSDTWQLIINTSTTIITFLMVFIIQNTQNRDQAAVNIKLDAVMRKLDIRSESLLAAEDKSDDKLEKEKQRIEHSKKPGPKRRKQSRR